MSAETKPDDAYTLRMRDLCEASGLERQAIHFYIQRGLLPPGKKTSRNAALYSEAHLERLKTIRRLKEERFLPLKAIKAVLDGQDENFSDAQRGFLSRVKVGLGETLGGDDDAAFVAIDQVRETTGLTRADIDEAIDQGTVAASPDRGAVAARDVWMLELFAQMRALGFSEADGFRVGDVAIYEKAIGELFSQEVALLTARLSGHQPSEAAAMITRALPVVHAFMTRYHRERVRDFFESLPDAPHEPGDE